MGPRSSRRPGADGWQLSNPPILALAPLRCRWRCSSAPAWRDLRPSPADDGYLEALIRARLAETLQIVTPAEPDRRGCQLSLRVAGGRPRGRRPVRAPA
jgi:kynureninase